MMRDFLRGDGGIRALVSHLGLWGEGDSRHEGPARLHLHEEEEELHPPAYGPAAFQFAGEQRGDGGGKVQLVPGLHEHLHERRGVVAFHHFPVEAHGTVHAVLVFGEAGASIVPSLQ